MQRILRFIGHEFKEALAPTIFFLILFHLAAFTKVLMLESYGITAITASVATVMALIAAKAILIADELPGLSHSAGRPLLVTVLCKAVIYAVLFLVLRLVEELVPLLIKHGGVSLAAQHFVEEISWPHFWAVQIWLFVALIFYAAVVELNAHLGAGSLRKAFLGWPLQAARRP
jgi:hypothetical protein